MLLANNQDHSWCRAPYWPMAVYLLTSKVPLSWNTARMREVHIPLFHLQQLGITCLPQQSRREHKKANKLRGLSPRANYTDERQPLVGKVSVNFLRVEGCRVVNAKDSYGRILGFLDLSRYYSFQVAPQLYWRGWVDHVPNPLPPRKSGSVGNRTRTCESVARNSDP
jgi:hypothetical protein